MNKILIIGSPGSGKSTFANKLGNILNRKIIHLDKLYYKSGWIAVPKNKWQEIVKNLLLKEQWIMDGNYRGTIDMRLEVADTVILFDFNKFLCLYRVFIRSRNKNQPFDKAEGNNNKLSWDLIKKITTFPKKKMLEKLEQHRDTKKIFVLKNNE